MFSKDTGHSRKADKPQLRVLSDNVSILKVHTKLYIIIGIFMQEAWESKNYSTLFSRKMKKS